MNFKLTWVIAVPTILFALVTVVSGFAAIWTTGVTSSRLGGTATVALVLTAIGCLVSYCTAEVLEERK